jgi:hypothetical protein
VLAAVAYLAGLAASGWLSPWDRRPLLDGLAPPSPYRWVRPPPALAQGNERPASGRFRLRLHPDGSEVGAFGTDDAQVDLVLFQRAFGPSPGQTQVEVDVDPLDPATLARPPAGLLADGNAYRVRARYLPSGRTITALAGRISAGLVYPPLTGAGTSSAVHRPRTLLWSRDGRAWQRLPASDAPTRLNVTGQLPAPGYLLVAVPAAPPAQGATRSRRSLPAIAVAVALALVLVLVLVVVWHRRPARRGGTPRP